MFATAMMTIIQQDRRGPERSHGPAFVAFTSTAALAAVDVSLAVLPNLASLTCRPVGEATG